jgi:SAM-dependent methyltransferase
MILTSGIPTFAQLDELRKSDFYLDNEQFNADFLDRHQVPMKSYRAKWEFDPYKLWSRRWEYPYVAGRVLECAKQRPGQPLRVLDAGSGVTYLPYFLCSRVPQMSVVAFDYDQSYTAMFDAINKSEGHDRVKFGIGMMQKLPYESQSFDAIVCVSVLEHTDEYDVILNEFDRVLKPGGQLALTFDLSLDGRFELSKPRATSVLNRILKSYTPIDLPDPVTELNRMDAPNGLLTTDAIKKSNPELLPWRHPFLKGIKDLLQGHGWTGGFASKSVICLDARRK